MDSLETTELCAITCCTCSKNRSLDSPPTLDPSAPRLARIPSVSRVHSSPDHIPIGAFPFLKSSSVSKHDLSCPDAMSLDDGNLNFFIKPLTARDLPKVQDLHVGQSFPLSSCPHLDPFYNISRLKSYQFATPPPSFSNFSSFHLVHVSSPTGIISLSDSSLSSYRNPHLISLPILHISLVKTPSPLTLISPGPVSRSSLSACSLPIDSVVLRAASFKAYLTASASRVPQIHWMES